MPTSVIVGAQWGDEGKGKIVDLFTEHADYIVRFQGGNNAGHTLVVKGETTVLHLIPSGILYDDKVCVIASGVVIDAEVLFQELDGLAAKGRSVPAHQLRISPDAHVVMPYHREMDLGREARRGDAKIGTTGRGIGPAYEDKVGRAGVRIRDLLDEARLRDVLSHTLPEKNALLSWLGRDVFSEEELTTRYLALGARIAPHVEDCRALLADADAAGKRILFEGAQGTLLDVGHGTYPFVTSSSTSTGGVCVGAGVPPAMIRQSVGVTKAYVTRVGSGPFPTELTGPIGEALRKKGHEFGATTGRPRRCGWFDAVLMRASQRLNRFTGMAITKLDVMTGLDEVKICVAYDTPRGRVEVADLDALTLEDVTPVYETMPGWTEDVREAQAISDLPANARAYLDRLAEVCDIPLAVVSVGPGRSETIVIEPPF